MGSALFFCAKCKSEFLTLTMRQLFVSHGWSIESHQLLLGARSQTSSKEAVIEKHLSQRTGLSPPDPN